MRLLIKEWKFWLLFCVCAVSFIVAAFMAFKILSEHESEPESTLFCACSAVCYLACSAVCYLAWVIIRRDRERILKELEGEC